MKVALKLLAFVILLSTVVLPAHAAPVFYSWGGEKIARVMDFPDTSDFQTASGEYIDAGSVYKQVTIFFIPVWNYDERWCGFIGSSNRYLPLDRGDLVELAGAAGIQLPENPSKPLWDSAGGKVAFALILGLYFAYQTRSRTAGGEVADGHEAPAAGEGAGA